MMKKSRQILFADIELQLFYAGNGGNRTVPETGDEVSTNASRSGSISCMSLVGVFTDSLIARTGMEWNSSGQSARNGDWVLAMNSPGPVPG